MNEVAAPPPARARYNNKNPQQCSRIATHTGPRAGAWTRCPAPAACGGGGGRGHTGQRRAGRHALFVHVRSSDPPRARQRRCHDAGGERRRAEPVAFVPAAAKPTGTHAHRGRAFETAPGSHQCRTCAQRRALLASNHLCHTFAALLPAPPIPPPPSKGRKATQPRTAPRRLTHHATLLSLLEADIKSTSPSPAPRVMPHEQHRLRFHSNATEHTCTTAALRMRASARHAHE